ASDLQALREIGRRGGIEIAYGDDVLRTRARVSLQVGEVTVQDAVVTVLAGTGLEAFVSLRGTTILVRAGSELAQGDTLTGRVTDTTGAALAGVRVSVVQGEQIQGVPTVNVSNTLGGQLPGLVTVNQSGEPGYDGATIRIRGNHTLNDNSALIVIDGVADRVGGLERLDPQDIENIS